MALRQSEIDCFHEFACWMIENRDVDSLADCLQEFEKEQAASIEAIKEGLADVDAGRTRPLSEFKVDLFARLREGNRVSTP